MRRDRRGTYDRYPNGPNNDRIRPNIALERLTEPGTPGVQGCSERHGETSCIGRTVGRGGAVAAPGAAEAQGGRPPVPNRAVLTGILFVLKSGAASAKRRHVAVAEDALILI